MSRQIIRNKKGMSEMIAYVILIVIALSLSVLVYTYLKQYVPKYEVPSCPDGISISLSSAECKYDVSNGSLSLSFLNRGRFNISAVYLKFGPEEREVKTLINEDNIYFKNDLSPEANITQNYQRIRLSKPGKYILEIEPAVITKKGLALCENSIISQPIICE
jgi:hypothetical protein